VSANTITIKVKQQHDGDVLIDAQCMALLFGVEVDAVRALPSEGGSSVIPRLWVKRGTRRAKEAQANTGSTAMLDGLRYWARHDYDADLEVLCVE
jgi:hypothetical protein